LKPRSKFILKSLFFVQFKAKWFKLGFNIPLKLRDLAKLYFFELIMTKLNFKISYNVISVTSPLLQYGKSCKITSQDFPLWALPNQNFWLSQCPREWGNFPTLPHVQEPIVFLQLRSFEALKFQLSNLFGQISYIQYWGNSQIFLWHIYALKLFCCNKVSYLV